MCQTVLVDYVDSLFTIMLIDHFLSKYIIIKSKSVYEASQNADLAAVNFILEFVSIYVSILINELFNIIYLYLLKLIKIDF